MQTTTMPAASTLESSPITFTPVATELTLAELVLVGGGTGAVIFG